MIAVMIDGQRTRRTYDPRDEAEEFAEQLRSARKNKGTAAFSLTPDVRAEAAKCVRELRPYNVSITDDALTNILKRLATAAGLAKWKHIGLRHSFATYHLAQQGDVMSTSFQMGNSPVVVHNHYKGLVSNGDVQRYRSLRPSAEADEVTVLTQRRRTQLPVVRAVASFHPSTPQDSTPRDLPESI